MNQRNNKKFIDDINKSMRSINMEAQVSEEAANVLTEKLKPKLRRVSRLRRRMKRDLLLKVEEEQQYISGRHSRSLSSSSSDTMNVIEEDDDEDSDCSCDGRDDDDSTEDRYRYRV